MSSKGDSKAGGSRSSNQAFFVEKIVGKKYENGKIQMLVKWQGFSEKHNSWEPMENLESCVRLLAEFEAGLYKRKEEDEAKKKGGKQPNATKASPANGPLPMKAIKTERPEERHLENDIRMYKENVPPSVPAVKIPVPLYPKMHLQLSESSDDERPSCSSGKRASTTPVAVRPSRDQEMTDLEKFSDGLWRRKLSSISSGSDTQPPSTLSKSSANTKLTSLNSLKEQARQWQAGKNVSKFGALLKSSPGEDRVEEAKQSIHSMQLARKDPEFQTSGGKSSHNANKESSKKDKKKSSRKSTKKSTGKGQQNECNDEDLASPLPPQTPQPSVGAPRGRSSSPDWKRTPWTTTFGLARGLELDKVVHNFAVGDRLFLFVTWKGLDAMDAVPIEELKKAYPAKVIEYFENMERREK